MDYRKRVYARYLATHIKGGAGVEPRDFDYQGRVFKNKFGPLLPADKSAAIFEMGCGSGAFLRFLQKEGYTRAQGMDQDADAVETARSLGVAGVCAGDARTHLESAAARYDCIVAIDVVEHFKKEELFELFDAVYRALTPGGVFIWQAPNADGAFFGRIRYGDLTHELAFTKASAWQLMLGAGYVDVQTFADEPVVTGLRSLARAVLWSFFKAVIRLYLFAESYAQNDCLLTANLIVRGRKPRPS